jgi:hypothetical protein
MTFTPNDGGKLRALQNSTPTAQFLSSGWADLLEPNTEMLGTVAPVCPCVSGVRDLGHSGHFRTRKGFFGNFDQYIQWDDARSYIEVISDIPGHFRTLAFFCLFLSILEPRDSL